MYVFYRILTLNREGEDLQMIAKNQNFKPYNQICENWIAQSVICQSDDNSVNVKIKGIYKEVEGLLEYCFHKDRKVTLTYDFTILQEVSPR